LKKEEIGKVKILVTGAVGFIASHLIESLLSDGHEVIGVDNFDPFYAAEIKKQNLEQIKETAKNSRGRFSFHELDICTFDSETLRGETIDLVIHLAAKAGVGPSLQEPAKYTIANVLGTQNILEWARLRQIQKFIFGSSSSVYGETSPIPFSESIPATHPISPYAASKRAGELYCDTYSSLYGMRIASLRLFTVYGPRQRPDLAIYKFTRKILRDEKIQIFGDGLSRRDYTHVTDIVSGIKAAANFLADCTPGQHEIFNLGGEKSTSLTDLIQMIETAIGTKANLDFIERQKGDVPITYAHLEKSRKLLGYSPQMPLKKGIEDFVQWLKSNG
jgi:UDP-glucuronate 4-epimerase